MPGEAAWPALPYDRWRDTCATLHLWTQIVGKIRLAKAPPLNHWWQVPLYVTARGLTTSPIPDSKRVFQIDFDFIDHLLRIATGDGRIETMQLAPRPVAEFYREFISRLAALGIAAPIWPMPVEIAEPIRFDADQLHAAYDPEWARRFWQVLVQADRVMQQFRARFLGKASPVHFFWGSFDLAVTRFSGRAAPRHPGAPGLPDRITHEAYSHEVSSCGFWPGSGGFGRAAFYCYAYPAPAGYAEAAVTAPGYYNRDLGEFVLPYDEMRQAADPDAVLLDFLQATYAAAADLAGWDRAALERR